MKEGDKVFVFRGGYYEPTRIDHFYISRLGNKCASFYDGPNARLDLVETEAQYWERQRKIREGAL